MAMGKPILGILSGEGASIIANAECGFSSPPGDLSALNELIKKALKTSFQDRRKLGKKGKDFYLKNFHSNIRKKELIEHLEC